MLKKILTYTLLVNVLLLLSSCEENINETKTTQNNLSNIDVKDGRLYFKDKEELSLLLNNLKDVSEDNLIINFEKNLYSKDFTSLAPILNEKNISQIQRHLNVRKNIAKNKANKTTTLQDDEDIIDNFDDIEDIFGETYFASFLNQESEIQVGDKIFKYTDKGLLITDAIDIEELYDFMIEKDIHSLGDIENIQIEQEYPDFNLDGGYKSVTPKIDSYLAEKLIAPENPEDGGSWVPSTGPAPLAPSPNLNNAINSLQVCSGTKPWIANLFGTTRVCIDKYESKRRVKVKYYNVHFFLGYAIGVKVKHQKKGTFGIWSKIDTEQVAMGINSISWFFDHSKVFSNTANNMVVNYYTHDGKLYSSINAYTNAIYIGQDKPLPNLPFADDVDIIIEWAVDNFGYNITEPQARQIFYDSLFNGASGVLSSLNRSMNKVAVILNQNGKSIVQYYDFSTSCTNCSKREKIFDFGFVTPKITYTFGVGHGSFNDIGFSDLKFDFKHPDLTGLSMYGMAKKDGVWHGIRMVF